MSLFVFRNNTVEPFFPKDYSFSGYDDISEIPSEVEGYVWFYQLPVKAGTESLIQEIRGCSDKFEYVLSKADHSKPFIAFTMDRGQAVSFDSGLDVMTAVSDYNSRLLEAERSYPNLRILDIHEFTYRYPEDELIDWRFWFISQMGMNPRLSAPFQVWYSKKLDQIALKRKKCLVLDLDNTLWGGVLGEDGIEGVKLGGDYPGKAFHFFQESLLALSKRGVILTVCSKNNEADVLEAWEKNPFMVLRKDTFAAWRINWNDKPSNIRELAEELNIGLDSLVFLDDNPSERELVRQTLPMVATPEFPERPYELPSFFKSLVENYFRVYSITSEDLNKTEQYKANARRAEASRSFVDLDSFIRSLDIRLTIEAANSFSIPRVAQMTQKTNQFNLTTRRYTEADVRRLVDSGWEIMCLGVEDKFGDSGITGCVMVDGDTIDTLLLSCRILGKGIESAFLKTVLRLMRDRGVKTVKAEYIPTPKNSQVESFYDRCGFTCVGVDENGVKSYVIDLASANLAVDDFYSIILE